MRKIATLAAAALVAGSALTTTGAEARGRGAAAAGLIGGLAAGALIGAAIADAQARPVGYGYAPAYGDRPAPRVYAEEPVYVSRRVYAERPAYGDGYEAGYGPGYGDRRPHRWERDCDRFDRGW